MEQLCWNLAYPLTCSSVGSACPYIMCEYRRETISSIKVKERGDFIRLALWHTSAIQTQAWHILCTGREKHQFNTNVQMQTPDLRYLFPWHSSVHTRVLWTDSQGSHTDKHTAPGRAVTSMTHHKVLQFYATTQCKLGRCLPCIHTSRREAAENIYLVLKHSVYVCVEFTLLMSFLIKRWEMQGC